MIKNNLKIHYEIKPSFTTRKIKELQQENKQLKEKYENAVADYEKTMFEKEQLNSLVNSCQEEIRRLKKQLEGYKLITIDYQELEARNKELKKQLENKNKQIEYLRRSIERKEDTIIDLQNEGIPYTNEYVAKLENQQKEFIEYMNKTIEELECDDVDDEEMKGYLIQRIDTFKEILSKYKEIIGDDK